MSGRTDSLVFFDVDTQVDFMQPTGKLHVPGAEQIVPNLQRLMQWADQNEVPVISTADAHPPDDAEFKIWPPHCVAGTPGQQRIPATQFPDPTVIGCRSGTFTPPACWVGQFILEKRAYSPQDNPNFEVVLQALGQRRAVVFGVATEYCVRAVTLELCRRNFNVDLVTDAIQAIAMENGNAALAEMTAAGAHLVTTAEVIGS